MKFEPMTDEELQTQLVDGNAWCKILTLEEGINQNDKAFVNLKTFATQENGSGGVIYRKLYLTDKSRIYIKRFFDALGRPDLYKKGEFTQELVGQSFPALIKKQDASDYFEIKDFISVEKGGPQKSTATPPVSTNELEHDDDIPF